MPKVNLNDEIFKDIDEYRKEQRLYQCDYCGKIFTRRHGNEKYCCDECKVSGNKLNKHNYYILHKKPRPKRRRKKKWEKFKQFEKAIPEYGVTDDFIENPDAYLYRLREKEKRIVEGINPEELTIKEYRQEIQNYLYRGNGMLLGDFRSDYDVWGYEEEQKEEALQKLKEKIIEGKDEE